MKTLTSCLLLLLSGCVPPLSWLGRGRPATEFIMTNPQGQVLGRGTLKLPFKFPAAGEGTATWRFTPTAVIGASPYWLKAKARLASGSGKATAACKDARFTLDFNPGGLDNKVTVSWATQHETAGTVNFTDLSGGHPCATFTFSFLPNSN